MGRARGLVGAAFVMDPLDLFNHLINFCLPALAVAAALVAAGRLLYGAPPLAWPLGRQFAVLAAAGVAVLLLGLVLTGSDGRMLSYAALVAVQALLLWWLVARRQDPV